MSGLDQYFFNNEQSAYDYIKKNKKQLTKELKEDEVRTLFDSKDKTIDILKKFNKLYTFTATYGTEKKVDCIYRALNEIYKCRIVFSNKI